MDVQAACSDYGRKHPGELLGIAFWALMVLGCFTQSLALGCATLAFVCAVYGLALRKWRWAGFIIAFVALVAYANNDPEIKQKEQAEKARHEVLYAREKRGEQLTVAECTELHGADMCKPIMSDEAWRQFQADAARSHEYSQAAHDYSDALHDYVDTYHRLPSEHVVIDPN